MPAALNAIGFIVLMLGGVIALVLSPKRNSSERRAFPAILLSLLVAAFLSVSSTHLCDAGNPIVQWLLPLPLVFAASYMLQPPYRLWVGGAIVLLSAALTFHAVSALHSGYPINNNLRRSEIVAEVRIRSSLKQHGIAHLPAGRVPAEFLDPERLAPDGRYLTYATRTRWYTYLTGMRERYDLPKYAVTDGGDIDTLQVRFADTPPEQGEQ